MKKILAFITLVCLTLPVAAQEEEFVSCLKECPQRGQQKANIFGTNFCCTTTDKGRNIDCQELWGTLRNGQCEYDPLQFASVLLYRNPQQPTDHIYEAEEDAKKRSKSLTATQRRNKTITVYHCANGKASLLGEFDDGLYSVNMYRADSWSTAFFAIPLELEQDLFDYLCESFNPNTFLNTPQTTNATVFKKPNIASQKRNTKKYKTAKKQQAEALKEQEEKQQSDKQPSAGKQQPASTKQPIVKEAQPLSVPSNAWNVLGDYFYPADVPGNLISMRRFETKNKSKEIKINFSSKNKQPFLEKLKTAHRYHPTRQTECAGGGTLYETISDGIYQAYLLSENTITVFSAAYSLPTLPEEPHASRMQKELCTLDVNSKW